MKTAMMVLGTLAILAAIFLVKYLAGDSAWPLLAFKICLFTLAVAGGVFSDGFAKLFPTQLRGESDKR